MPPLGLPKLSVDPVLFLPLFLGTLRDHSGYGNHGVATGGHWAQIAGRDGIHHDAGELITVADSPELRLTRGTIFLSGNFSKYLNAGRLFSKCDVGGANYDFYFSSTDVINFYDGTNVRTAAILWSPANSIAVSFADGEIAKGYTDGVFTSNFGAASDVSANDAPLIIGNLFNGTRPQLNPMACAILYPEILAPAEILSLHACSQSLITPRKQWPDSGLRYPDRGDPYTHASGDPVWLDNLQTARVTLADQTSGCLSNTPALIVTGAWALREDDTGRYYYCVSAGKLRVRLLGADGFTTALFAESGGATITKDATGFDLDFGTGDIVRAVELTAP